MVAKSKKTRSTDQRFSDVPLVTAPDYETPSANRRVELYRGKFQIHHDGASTTEKGPILLEWFPSPRIRFSFDPGSASSLNKYRPGKMLKIHIPKYGLRGSAFVTHWGSEGVRGVFSDTLEGITSKSDDPSIQRLIFHLPNFRRLDGMAVRSGRTVHFARYECQSSESRLTLDPAPHMDENIDRLSSRGGYAFTYTGTIERCDGKTFRKKHAVKLLEHLHLFLSFCAGRWTSPMLVAGTGRHGATVWRHWAVWKTSPWTSSRNWLPLHSGPRGAFDGFMKLAETEDHFRALGAAIHWYVESNGQSGGVDGGLILSQAALELLAWQKLVVIEDIVDEGAFRDLTAYSKIRMLLRNCSIPLEIPKDLREKASKLEYSPKDGAGLITSIRNDTVHPPKKGAYARPPSEAIIAAWKLSLWYVELVILSMCGHSGSYHNRTTATGTVRDEVPVPWSAG